MGIKLHGEAKVEVCIGTPRIIVVVQLNQARVYVVQIKLHHSVQIILCHLATTERFHTQLILIPRPPFYHVESQVRGMSRKGSVPLQVVPSFAWSRKRRLRRTLLIDVVAPSRACLPNRATQSAALKTLSWTPAPLRAVGLRQGRWQVGQYPASTCVRAQRCVRAMLRG